jgi:N-acetylmuramate 1-kinase
MTTPTHASPEEHRSSVDDRADGRLSRIRAWLPSVLGRADFQIAPASADASFRRYFRVCFEGDALSRIVMDAPPDKEDVGPYIKIARMLVEADVNAPLVLERNLDEGFLLLSDLGSKTYLTDLSAGRNVDVLYGDALAALVQMQKGCTRIDELPPYDKALLLREMGLFPEWFLARHLGLEVSAEERRGLDTAFASLVDSALAQPCVFVHRDYHSRNLMNTDGASCGRNPGVLDFQDAVRGPVTYDLVSLLRDCYVAWPRERVQGWVRDYRRLAMAAGIDAASSEAELMRWFDLMGVQRHLKAIGIFARLWHRDGKGAYLNDIPRTLDYIRAVAPSYPSLAALTQIIDNRVQPALATMGTNQLAINTSAENA